MHTPNIRILIADDHEIVRAGFARFISDQADMCVAAEAATGDEVIARVRREEFDVVLREFQIFHKLAAGQSPTEIAGELHLSVKTVSTYRARVLEKMQLKTNADLTHYALKKSLLA